MKQYYIETTSREHFAEVIGKLTKVGFVYSEQRQKTAKEIFKVWGYYNVIILTKNQTPCKMVLHGCMSDYKYGENISVDDFLEKIFPTW